MEAKASYSQGAANTGGTSSNLTKITGVFKTENGQGYEVRVNDEIAAKLASVKPGSYLKVYVNKSKAGTEYLSLAVKALG